MIVHLFCVGLHYSTKNIIQQKRHISDFNEGLLIKQNSTIFLYLIKLKTPNIINI